MKAALNFALIRAIRTFAQVASGGLSGIVVLGIAAPDIIALGQAVALVGLSAVLAAAVAFLQNFAEALPD